MSKATRCDCCGRSTPDIDPKYSKRKRWCWFRFEEDSQGGQDISLDICEGCWSNLSKLKGQDNEAK